MTTQVSRRDFLKASGSLLFTVSATGAIQATIVGAANGQGMTFANPAPDLIDTWLRISGDGRVLAFTGKVDHGQGLDTAIAQIIAEEMDVAPSRVAVVMGDTAFTPNQGGASASTGIRAGANPLRNAAAEARRLLAQAGAEKLGVPASAVSTQDGAVFVTADATKRVRYEELFGDKPIGAKLDWNKQVGNGMNASGQAKPKTGAQYKVIGQPVGRADIPDKVFGTEDYCCNVQVTGMLHARMVRPEMGGAVPAKVDESSIRNIAGAKVVWKQNFLAVVAENEWDAIKAARQLKVEWTAPQAVWPGHDGLYDHIRKAPVTASNGQNAFSGKKEFNATPTNEALKKAAKVVEAEYECAFQSHARMGPSVAVADVRDGTATIWTDAQKPHFQRQGLAKFLGLTEDKVRVIWKGGSGSYGRSDADEAPYEAAFLSKELGRPVRVQWMRHEGIAWDPKAPAAVISMKAGLDSSGNVDGWLYRAKGFSGWDVKWFADGPEQTLAGMQLGHKKWNMNNFDTPTESYQWPNAVQYWETVAPLQQEASPLRCAHMRAPQELQSRFANECFIDEVAAAAATDPIAFRLKYLKEEREVAVLKAAAERVGWKPHSGRPNLSRGNIMTGRGIAVHSGYGAFVAVVADVEVNRTTGRIWAKRVTVAHDCGLVINPRTLRTVIEGNVVQGLSRALFEEVQFDDKRVLSNDWTSYPILDVKDAPETVDIVLINRPDKAPGGAGEPTQVIVPAAIANAFYNATGVRMRRYPLVAARVKKALAA